MPTAFPISPFDPDGENWWSKGTAKLAKRICDAGLLVRGLRVQLRFGELTRAPLRLIRFEMNANEAECDWIARSPDPWDADLHPEIGRRHASLQALQDAIDVRQLLFTVLPDIDVARLRIYRESTNRGREMIISGQVHRNVPSFRTVRSIAMRAKLLGFRFSLENEILMSGRLGEEQHYRPA